MYATNIETQTRKNKKYRKILYTDEYQQLVLMEVKTTIPREKHDGSQFIRFEMGRGRVIIEDENGRKIKNVKDGDAVIIPPKTYHTIINTGSEPLKLYAIYSPPEHK